MHMRAPAISTGAVPRARQEPDGPPPRPGLAERVVAKRRRALGAVLVGVAVLFVARVMVGGELTSTRSNPINSESARAAELLSQRFQIEPPGFVLVLGAKHGDVDDAAVTASARAIRDRLADRQGVISVTSYWDDGARPLRSSDGRRGLILASLSGDESARTTRAGELADEFRSRSDPVTIDATGTDVVDDEIAAGTERDLLRAELVAFPVLLLLLAAFFRRFVVALIPIVAGILSVVGGIAIIGLVAAFTSVTVFATNLIVGLGLGLSIDYALLLISRYREELAGGSERNAALARSIRVAGRTVAFSAATVAIALTALLLFPIPFLRSMAYGGIAATVVSAVVAILVVPALLGALGHRVNPARTTSHADSHGLWYRVATAVMRRPVLVAGSVVAVLAVAVTPLLGLNLGVNDDRNLPESSPARRGAEILRSGFDGRESSPLQVVSANATDRSHRGQDVAAYAARLSRVDGVTRVDAPDGSYVGGRRSASPRPSLPPQVRGDAVYLSVIPGVEPISDAGQRLVRDLRAVDAPFNVDVGGTAARRVDSDEALTERVPMAFGFIAVVTFVALFLMFGSLVVPTKALVLNTLSLSATFGAVVWIFQDGNLSGVLDFTPTGSIPSAIPVLVFCVAFGLSMDYEVFLLSRIKEEYDRTGDSIGSVATGLDYTGRIVTFAALLVAVVFAGFLTSSITTIKLLGFGLMTAVLLDAYIIRGALVPAFMRLAGRANWWAPQPVRRLHDRFSGRKHENRRVRDRIEPSVPASCTQESEIEGLHHDHEEQVSK
jgi:RND superfamily putative drug exporter